VELGLTGYTDSRFTGYKRKGVVMRFLGILVLVVLAGCTPGFVNHWGGQNIHTLIERTALVRTKYTIEEVGEGSKMGIGVPIEDGMVIVPAHVIIPPPHRTVNVRRGLFVFKMTLPNNILDVNYLVDGKSATLVGFNERIDIAVLQTDDVERFPFVFADSDYVWPGDEVLIPGYSFSIVRNIKDGMISARDFKLDDTSSNFEPGEVFMLSAPINVGDSGAPVMIMRNGGFLEVCGIVVATIQGAKGISYAVTSNAVLETVAKIVAERR
jgi:hypothetical protein